MNYLWHSFLGLIVGYIITAPIGPVNLAIVQATVSVGHKAGVRMAIGSALAETFYCLLAVVGVSILFRSPEQSERIFFILELLSVPLLLVLGILSLREKISDVPAEGVHKKARGILVGFGLNLFNPILLPYWLGVCGFLRKYDLLSNELDELLIFGFLGGVGTFLLHYTLVQISAKSRFLLNLKIRWVVSRAIGVIFSIIAIYQALNLAHKHWGIGLFM